MPSGPPSTSMVLMDGSVLVSHMTTGLLLAKPWLDLGSTAAPRALVSGISPAGSSVSRLKTETRARIAGTRNVQAATRGIRVDVVETALAAHFGGLHNLVLGKSSRRGHRSERKKNGNSAHSVTP